MRQSSLALSRNGKLDGIELLDCDRAAFQRAMGGLANQARSYLPIVARFFGERPRKKDSGELFTAKDLHDLCVHAVKESTLFPEKDRVISLKLVLRALAGHPLTLDNAVKVLLGLQAAFAVTGLHMAIRRGVIVIAAFYISDSVGILKRNRLTIGQVAERALLGEAVVEQVLVEGRRATMPTAMKLYNALKDLAPTDHMLKLPANQVIIATPAPKLNVTCADEGEVSDEPVPGNPYAWPDPPSSPPHKLHSVPLA